MQKTKIITLFLLTFFSLSLITCLRIPSAKAITTTIERFVNGGFENGSMTGWNNLGSSGNKLQVLSNTQLSSSVYMNETYNYLEGYGGYIIPQPKQAHNGSYCLGDWNIGGGSGYFNQTFSPSINVSNINSFGFYVMQGGASDDGNVAAAVQIVYSDGSKWVWGGGSNPNCYIYGTNWFGESGFPTIFGNWTVGGTYPNYLPSYFNVLAAINTSNTNYGGNQLIKNVSAIYISCGEGVGASVETFFDDFSLIEIVPITTSYALTVNSNINAYFTMNGSILSTEFGSITPYSNVSVPEAYYAFTRLNSSLGAYNFSHWYVLFTDNGSQVTINSTSTFIIINLNANLTVWLIYASTSIVTLPEFHIPFLVPLLIQILDLLFSFGAMGYLYRESRNAKTGLRAFILIMLIFMLMITIFLAANVLYGFG